MKPVPIEEPVERTVIMKRYHIKRDHLDYLAKNEGLPRLLTSRTGSKRPRYVYYLSEVEEWFRNRSEAPVKVKPRRTTGFGSGMPRMIGGRLV